MLSIFFPLFFLFFFQGHCTGNFTARPSTAPVGSTFRADRADDFKKDWDTFRFGKQAKSFGGKLILISLIVVSVFVSFVHFNFQKEIFFHFFIVYLHLFFFNDVLL